MGARTFVNDRISFSFARNWRRGVDMPMLLSVVALLVFGLIMLYSASFDFSFIEYGSATYMFNRQLMWLGIGVAAAFLLSVFDYHNWRKMVLPAMLATIALLVTVLFVNEIRLGASRTLLNGSYQPSELAKLMAVIYLAVWLYAKRQFLHDVTIGIEALINMTVMVGLMPFAGNALPFISAGGSNLVSSLCAVGIMLNISRQSSEHAMLEENEWRSFGAVVDLRRRDGRRSVSRARRSQRTHG